MSEVPGRDGKTVARRPGGGAVAGSVLPRRVYGAGEIVELAYQNKRVVYDLLFRVAAQTLLTLGADPKRLGAQLGMTAVLHTWGSAMTHHPHLHCIVPGGGMSLDGTRWVASKYPRFLLPVRVLSALFRRLMLERLRETHRQG